MVTGARSTIFVNLTGAGPEPSITYLLIYATYLLFTPHTYLSTPHTDTYLSTPHPNIATPRPILSYAKKICIFRNIFLSPDQ
jgi:hypothetical protein